MTVTFDTKVLSKLSRKQSLQKRTLLNRALHLMSSTCLSD